MYEVSPYLGREAYEYSTTLAELIRISAELKSSAILATTAIADSFRRSTSLEIRLTILSISKERNNTRNDDSRFSLRRRISQRRRQWRSKAAVISKQQTAFLHEGQEFFDMVPRAQQDLSRYNSRPSPSVQHIRLQGPLSCWVSLVSVL